MKFCYSLQITEKMNRIVYAFFAKYEITSAKESEGMIKGETLVILSRGMPLLCFSKASQRDASSSRLNMRRRLY
jgi:hypothetical protein